jgi:hypothetical protein
VTCRNQGPDYRAFANLYPVEAIYMTDAIKRDSAESVSTVPLWTGLLVPPIAWAFQLQANYVLVSQTCQQGSRWPLHLVTLIALLITLAAGFGSWRARARVNGTHSDDEAGPSSVARFMAVLGVMTSALFLLVIIAQAVPSFIFHGCQP